MKRVKLILRKRKRGDYGRRYGDVQIMKAVIAAKGRVAMAAQKLGCTWKTVWDAKNRNPEIAQVIKDQRELFIDQAEDALQAAVKKHEPWAVCFLLKTLGRERGYIENGPVQQVIVASQRTALKDEDPFKAAAQAISLLVQQGILPDQSPLAQQLEPPIEVTASHNGANGYHANGNGNGNGV
jgi:hypothetical protein